VTDAVVHGIRGRPLELPLAPPAELAGGAMSTMPIVLVDVLASDGRCGHSYLRTYTPLALRSLAALVEDLADLLVGQPATPEAVERALPYTLRLLGTRGLVGAALAALDIALWDVRAQGAGRPLARLLGSEVDRIPVYATIRSRDPRSAAEEAHAAADRGFAAVKVKLGGRPLEDDERLVKAVRATVGAGVDVLGDFNQSLTVQQALGCAAQLDELGLAWIEEPTSADDLAGHARIRQALRTPVQLGENLEGTAELTHSIDTGASDLLTFDAVKIGGVTGWRRAASLAADAGLRVSSHSFPEISVHLLAGTPTAHWLEHLDHLAPIRASGLRVEDGHLRVLEGAGIGLRWDEDAVARLQAGRAIG
jgi:mandelate racemase